MFRQHRSYIAHRRASQRSKRELVGNVLYNAAQPAHVQQRRVVLGSGQRWLAPAAAHYEPFAASHYIL